MINPRKSKELYGQKLTATINNSPLPVLIEYPDGRENPIVKAYFVMGRTAAIKILIDDYNDDGSSKDDRIQELEDEVKGLESDLDSANGYKDELEEWEDEFPHDTPDELKSKWDAIEESISQFADVADISLVANDADNIRRLQTSFELRVAELKDADEIIGELKLENLAANKRIEELEGRLELIREQQVADKDI